MKLGTKYNIRAIAYRQAMTLVVEKHYLHRKASCSFAFGLFEGEEIKGVITYGSPASKNVCKGICGEEEMGNVIELTRLWVDDSVDKNGESFLIGNTIPLIDKEIIVSFADTQQGHTGIVYQATNWIYTGLSAKRTDWKVEGIKESHNRTMTGNYSSKELKEKYGDRFTLVPRSRKHRYLYFNCSKGRKRYLLSKLKYKIENYPKTNNNGV